MSIELKPITRLKMKAISHVTHKLNQWEARFIGSIKDRFQLTFKQKMIVDDMYLQRVKGEYTGAGLIMESYDDVHDFAR